MLQLLTQGNHTATEIAFRSGLLLAGAATDQGALQTFNACSCCAGIPLGWFTILLVDCLTCTVRTTTRRYYQTSVCRSAHPTTTCPPLFSGCLSSRSRAPSTNHPMSHFEYVPEGGVDCVHSGRSDRHLDPELSNFNGWSIFRTLGRVIRWFHLATSNFRESKTATGGTTACLGLP